MWFLWLFGNNIEDSMTRPRFVAFYLICGLAAALAQVAANAGSNVPMVGASGAISGVMGAYLILYPRVRVFTLVPLGFFFWTIALPAWVMLLYWAFLQLASGVVSLAGSEDRRRGLLGPSGRIRRRHRAHQTVRAARSRGRAPGARLAPAPHALGVGRVVARVFRGVAFTCAAGRSVPVSRESTELRQLLPLCALTRCGAGAILACFSGAGCP